MLQQDQSLYITDKGGLRCRPKAANKKKLCLLSIIIFFFNLKKKRVQSTLNKKAPMRHQIPKHGNLLLLSYDFSHNIYVGFIPWKKVL